MCRQWNHHNAPRCSYRYTLKVYRLHWISAPVVSIWVMNTKLCVRYLRCRARARVCTEREREKFGMTKLSFTKDRIDPALLRFTLKIDGKVFQVGGGDFIFSTPTFGRLVVYAIINYKCKPKYSRDRCVYNSLDTKGNQWRWLVFWSGIYLPDGSGF